MLLERQISIVLTGIAAALVLPEFLGMSRAQHGAPGAGLVFGAVFGGLGVALGILVVSGHSVRSSRLRGYTVWMLIALVFTGAALLGALHSPNPVPRVVIELAGLLPLVGPALILTRQGSA